MESGGGPPPPPGGRGGRGEALRALLAQKQVKSSSIPISLCFIINCINFTGNQAAAKRPGGASVDAPAAQSTPPLATSVPPPAPSESIVSIPPPATGRAALLAR